MEKTSSKTTVVTAQFTHMGYNLLGLGCARSMNHLPQTSKPNVLQYNYSMRYYIDPIF